MTSWKSELSQLVGIIFRVLATSIHMGYIYKDNFNPLIPFENLLSKDDESCGYAQFGLRVYLEVNIKYILVVSTALPRETGAFSIHVTGLDSVVLNRSGKYLYS